MIYDIERPSRRGYSIAPLVIAIIGILGFWMLAANSSPVPKAQIYLPNMQSSAH